VYQCPSDEHNGCFQGNAVHNYAASRGPTEVFDNPSCSCSEPWNDLKMSPIDDPKDYAGPFTRMSVGTAARQITDGLSNTI
jgi:hypothetical protein